MAAPITHSSPPLEKESQGGVQLPPSPEKILAKIDLSITLALHTWSSLTIAVQNQWGGPSSADKRDWFAGAISDLLATTTDPDDVDYLEEFLHNVMSDEFEAVLDDGSAEEVAARIIGLRKLALRGDFSVVDDMARRWEERQRRGGERTIRVQQVDGGEDDDDTDWDGSEEGDEEENGDVEMEEAPALIKIPKEKATPEIDGDGFTKVVGRKKPS